MPGKEDKGGSRLYGLMLPPIIPDFVGTLSLVSDTYKDIEPFCPVSPVILSALIGTGASGKVQATPVPWHVATSLARWARSPKDCAGLAFSGLLREPALRALASAVLARVLCLERRVHGRQAGLVVGLGQCSIPECPASLMVLRTLF